MPLEYVMLALSVALLFVLILMQIAVGSREMGGMVLAGPRDDLPAPSKFLARVRRTVENHKEGLILFAPLVLIAGQMGAFDNATAIGSQLFFYSRIVHAVLYILGVPVIRPLVYLVGIVGTGMIFYSLFA